MDANMSIEKKEESQEQPEGAEDSMDEDTPEADAVPPNDPEDQTNQPQPKRKGGRKPIYATSEERKQRNRQAQAAFRERRTEYIKQLEDTIRVHETNLHALQTAQRSAFDECLMLRYKNSLLERILLEKGIDVQAELRLKTGSPSLGPTHLPANIAQPPTIQRAIMNRHHQARRSNSNIAPKLESSLSSLGQGVHSNPSPQSRPTPTSHHSSPNAQSPGFPSVMTPPGSDVAMQHQRIAPMKSHIPQGLANIPGGLQQQQQQQMISALKLPGSAASGINPQAAYYTPPFRGHIEQLEQEYEQPEPVDNIPNEPSGPGPFPQSGMQQQQHYGVSQQQMQQAQAQQQQQPSQQQPTGNFGAANHMMYPFDAEIDADPFGLSASMSFPTSFSFDTSSMR